jgi:predicted CoA-binding protein
MTMDFQKNLIEDDRAIGELLRSTRRIAVLGIKTAAQSTRAAYYVPDFLQRAGAEIIPVPVYYPDVRRILGVEVHRDLATVPGAIDLVDVFRRPADIPQHLEALLRLRPRAVWFQSGIRNDAAAQALASAGILVVQDRCLMVEWKRHVGG